MNEPVHPRDAEIHAASMATRDAFARVMSMTNEEADAKMIKGTRRALSKRIRKLKRKQLTQGQRLLEVKRERDQWRSLAGDLWSQLESVTGEQRDPIMQMYIDEYERLEGRRGDPGDA